MFLTWPDVRIAVRRLTRAPGFTSAAALLLALSIAGTSFIFSTVRGLLLQSIPYVHAERLVVLSPMAPFWEFFEELRDARGVFEQLGCYTQRAANLSGLGPAERVLIGRVSPGFLPITGVRLSAGRGFRNEEFAPPHDRVALITDRLWRRRFAAAQDAIGQAVTLDGHEYTVIGVLPPDFRTIEQMERAHELPFDREVSLLVPLPDRTNSYDPTSTDRAWRGLTVVGRLRQRILVEQANRELAPILAHAQMRYRFPEPFAFHSLRTAVAGGLGTQLALVAIAVGLFLVVGCANVTNLVLGRIEGRRRELAICAAIGSNARRIVGSVLAETVLLSLAGGMLGLLISWQAVTAMKVLAGGMLDIEKVTVDFTVLAFTAAVALATGVVVGIGPALRHARTDPTAALQTASRGSQLAGGISFTSLLVVVQVTLAVLLVVLGALLARTFVRSVSVPNGFATDGILTAEISLDRSGYWQRNSTRYFAELLDRAATLPDVRGTALASAVPGGQSDGATGVRVDGRSYTVDAAVVSPSYFSVLSIPLLAGASFGEQDTSNSPYVVVVNEAFARTHWETPGRAVGRTIILGERVTHTAAGDVVSDIERRVVGVVANSRDVAQGAAPRPKIYWSYRQGPASAQTQMTVLVRAGSGDAAALVHPLTRLVQAINPDQPLYNVLPLSEIMQSRFARERAMAAVMNVFAILTLIVAALGVHAAMSCVGALRRHEVGVRLALGGSRLAVLRTLAWRGAKQVGVGLELGVFLAVAGVTFLRAWLFGTGSADLPTVAGAVLLVTVVSAAALLAPAWRATRVDPIETLRTE